MKKRKVKLFASIASLGLVVAVMGVGVWAATQQAVKVSSQVSFVATSVAADIKLQVTNDTALVTGTPNPDPLLASTMDILDKASLAATQKPGATESDPAVDIPVDSTDPYLYDETKELITTARRIAYFNNDTAKTLYDNRVYLNLQDKDEDGYLNVGAKVVYTFTIEALESSAPIYYHITANLFDTAFYTSDAGKNYKISDVFEVQIFDVSTSVPGEGEGAPPVVTPTDQQVIKPSSNATANDVTTDVNDGDDVTDSTIVGDYPTAILTNWDFEAQTPPSDTTADTKAIQPGQTRTIQVVYTVKDIDGAGKHLYQGISYTMKSLQLGDIYIKLANNGKNITDLPNYDEDMDATDFDKHVNWITGKEDKPEGTVVPPATPPQQGGQEG